MANTIAITQCTYPRRDGQAEWASDGLENTVMADLPKVDTNPSANQAWRNLKGNIRLKCKYS